jgi:DNA-directed RNA polymerase specialized sigma24 family protein
VAVDRAAEEAVAAASDLARAVERSYPMMLRIASFRGARRADVRRILVDAVRAAAAVAPEESERVLLRTTIARTSALERETPRARDWKAEDEPAIDLRQVEPEGARWAGWFKAEPPSFTALERGGSREEARQAAEDALSRLPFSQRVVIVLRDVGAWSADDVTQLLRVDPKVQRALLHNARSRIRRALERAATGKARTRA